jgi:hypothetical protein
MTKPDGFFELRTPRQLLEKLEADADRLRSLGPISKQAQYAAFDFFVTAEHLPEWLANTPGADLKTLRSYPDGDLVSHVANGAKHFHVDPNRHNAVQDTHAHSGAFQADAFQSDAFDVDRLIIERADGRIEPVLDIVDRVLEYWKSVIF